MNPGVLTKTVLLRGPASSRHTLLPLPANRPATALPALPPPITMTSNSSMISPLSSERLGSLRLACNPVFV